MKAVFRELVDGGTEQWNAGGVWRIDFFLLNMFFVCLMRKRGYEFAGLGKQTCAIIETTFQDRTYFKKNWNTTRSLSKARFFHGIFL